jgi:hypothetical protein
MESACGSAAFGDAIRKSVESQLAVLEPAGA